MKKGFELLLFLSLLLSIAAIIRLATNASLETQSPIKEILIFGTSYLLANFVSKKLMRWSKLKKD